MGVEWEETTGLVGGLTLATMMAPQVWKVYRTQSARDLSWGFLAVYACGLTLLLVYEVSRGLWALYVPQSFEFTMLLTQITMKFVYDRKQRLREHDCPLPSDSSSSYAHPQHHCPARPLQHGAGTNDSLNLYDPSNPFFSPTIPKTNHAKLFSTLPHSGGSDSCMSAASIQARPHDTTPFVPKPPSSIGICGSNPFTSPNLHADISSNPFLRKHEIHPTFSTVPEAAFSTSHDEHDRNPFLASETANHENKAVHKHSASGNPVENGGNNEDDDKDCRNGIDQTGHLKRDVSVVLNPLNDHGLG